MAKSNAVWGIDIGQCALKALRCRPGDEDDVITADAFDYIEYPKILSQPDADPAELVREALELFLSRNTVRGDKVAISVSGQSGLARFIKLPPVESKKIPDIVKYEARQQIPFALEDVVWDYQQMAGGSEEEGFALETEVGLFAMKRDQVERALKPFEDAGIEVDIVQLTPLTIYNYTVFDQMQDLPPADQYDPDNPPESVVVLSLGTDSTDLVITNGYRVWQRSVPLGGSHFTKALTKELRLTFAKAEHIKKNAAQAEDPKAVFQAMRPVFNDLLTQIQRSIGFFTSIDRSAKINRVIALGNAMKLPGLQKYLSQNLGYPVTEVQKYRGLTGDVVVGEPIFKDSLLSFAVCYGLALQGLNKGKLSTNLLPREIVTDRLIRDKKPWAVAMVAALLLGCTVNFFGHWRTFASVGVEKFKPALAQAKTAEDNASNERNGYETARNEFKTANDLGEGLVSNVEGRLLWLEMLKALDQCLPSDGENRPEKIWDRQEIHFKELECEWSANLSAWYAGGIADKIREAQLASGEGGEAAPGAEGVAPAAAPPPPPPSAVSRRSRGRMGMNSKLLGGTGEAPPDPAAQAAAAAPAPVAGGEGGPQGAGWIIQLKGYHYHNHGKDQGSSYVRDTLIKNLKEKVIQLAGKDGQMTEVPVKDLGIGFPAIVSPVGLLVEESITDPNYVAPAEKDRDPSAVTGPPKVDLERFDFTLQFCWVPTPLSKREEIAKERAKAAENAPPAAPAATEGQPAATE